MSLVRSESVFEKQELDGLWCLPGYPDQRCHGRLTIDNGAFSLQLWEGLTGVTKVGQYVPVVYGTLAGNRPITLFRNYHDGNVEEETRWGKSSHSVFSVLNVVKNAHFATMSDVKFYEVCFGINHLEDWRELNAFKHSRDPQIAKNVYIDNEYPRPLKLYEDENFVVHLVYEFSEEYTEILNAGLEHRAFIELKFKGEERPYFSSQEQPGVDELVSMMKSFFWLAIGKDVFSYEMVGHSKCFIADERFNAPEDIDILQSRSVSTSGKRLIFMDMLLPWREIQDNPQKYFKSWIKNYRHYNNTIWGYIASVKSHEYTATTLPILIPLLEGFHRLKFPQSAPDASPEYRKHCEAITDACIAANIQDRDLEWLKKKLTFRRKEPTLHRRIMELLEDNENIFVWLLGDKRRFSEVARYMVNKRNAQFHGQEEDNPFSEGFNTYFEHVRLVRILLAVLLLQLAGVDEAKILKRLQKYQYAVENAKYWRTQSSNGSSV